MLTLDSGACNVIPFTALGDPKAVREGSRRYVRLPSGKLARVIALNGVWVAEMGMLEYTLQTLPPVTGLPEGTEVFVSNCNGNIARLINGVWRYISPFIVTWVTRPPVNSVPVGTEIQVTDYGNQKWVNDGTYWRPAQGRVSVYGNVGGLASPIAVLSAVGTFTIPGGNPKIPAGMIIPGMRVCACSQYRKSGSAATMSVNTRLGMTSGQYLAGGSIVNNDTGDIKSQGFAFFGSAKTKYLTGGWAPENSGNYGGVVTEPSTDINTDADMYVSCNIAARTAPDSCSLLSHYVWLEV